MSANSSHWIWNAPWFRTLAKLLEPRVELEPMALQRYWVLVVILIMGASQGLLIALPMAFLLPDLTMRYLGIVAISLLISITLMLMVRRGLILPARWVAIASYWLLGTATVLTSGGAHSSFLMVYGSFVVMSILLFGIRGGVVLTVINSLMVILMLWLERAMLLPPSRPDYPLVLFCSAIYNFLTIVSLLTVTVITLQHTNRRFKAELEDRLRAEAEQRGQEQVFRSIFDLIPFSMAILSHDARIVEANQAMSRAMSRSREDMINRRIDQMDDNVNQAAWLHLHRQTMEQGRLQNQEFDYRDLDTGESNHCLVSSESIEFHGEPHILLIAVDITDQLNVEKSLQQAQAFNQSMFDNLPGLVFMMDPDGQVIRWNREMEIVSGYSREELVAFPAREHFTPEDWPRFDEVLLNTVATGRDELEVTLVTRSGERIPFFFTYIRCFFSEHIFIIGTGLNTTERKRLEEQFRQAQKMEAVGRLAGGVAHDFNNILTVISGYSEMLLAMRPNESDPDQGELRQILEASHRGSALTQQLLAFSRQQVMHPKVLLLNKVICNLEKMLQRLIGEDCLLELSLDPSPGYIKADPSQIEQVLMNLVVNARDAMPKGGKISIATTRMVVADEVEFKHDLKPGRYILLTVTDTGTGMSEELQKRIFEPFFTTKSMGHGTGLGLATVLGIVKQSGGHISTHSSEGVGTTFKIYLPEIADATMLKIEASSLVQVRGSETILLVEDEVPVRRLVERILIGNGYKVLSAAAGPEALVASRQHGGRVDLLLTDVIMPGGMTGTDLAHLLLEMDPTLKVIYMSGYTSTHFTEEAFKHAKVDLLHKPFSGNELLTALRRKLDEEARPSESAPAVSLAAGSATH